MEVARWDKRPGTASTCFRRSHCSTATKTPGVGIKQDTVQISNCNPAVIPTWGVDVFDYRRPDISLGWVFGRSGSPRTPSTARTALLWAVVAADYDYCWGAVTGDEGARGVDDKAQVLVR